MPTPSLTSEERREFDALDEVVARGVKAAKAVLDAGRALAQIRERQLYRAVAGTWEVYLSDRHGLTRRRADQIIAAANAMAVIQEAVQQKTGTMVPGLDELTERGLRPLAGMDAEAVAAVVADAAGDPAGITPTTIRKAAKRRKAAKAKAYRPRRFKVPGAVVVITFNRRSNGSVLEALAAAQRQAEEQLLAENRPSEAA